MTKYNLHSPLPQVLGTKKLYESPWVNLEHWDVLFPDGSRIPDHHVVTYTREAVAVVVFNSAGEILLHQHYRFQTDTLNWEVPAGGLDAGETLEQAAARELLEETGYCAEEYRYLGYYHPSQGSSNQKFHVLTAQKARQLSAEIDVNETLALCWFSPAQIRQMIHANQLPDGFSLVALMWVLLEAL